MKRVTENYDDHEEWEIVKIEYDFNFNLKPNPPKGEGVRIMPNPHEILNCKECVKDFRMDEAIVYMNTSPHWTWPALVGREYVTFHCPICEEVCFTFTERMS